MRLSGGDPEEFEPREAAGPANQPSSRVAFSIFTYRVEIPYRFRKWPAADFFVLAENVFSVESACSIVSICESVSRL